MITRRSLLPILSAVTVACIALGCTTREEPSDDSPEAPNNEAIDNNEAVDNNETVDNNEAVDDPAQQDEPPEQGGLNASKVDLLWVIDNSGSMCEEQGRLRDEIGLLTASLVDAEIDFQMGVITTDVFDRDQRGRLQNVPNAEGGAACTVTVDVEGCAADLPLLVRSADPRYQDDPSALAEDFGCMATVGTRGYGFEAGLEAMRLALSPRLLESHNAGLLRDDSMLVVIFVTDENDCSDGGVLDKTNGNVCEWERDQLIDVQEYIDTLGALRPDGNLLVTGVTGPDSGLRFDYGEDVLPSCASDLGEGYAGWRYHDLMEAFGGRNNNLCAESAFEGALEELAQQIVSAPR